MDQSLGLVGLQYNIGLAVFYVSYIASELPSNYLLKRVGAKLWLPFLVASWGIITILMAFMKNYSSFLACRFFLGLFEGGLLPVSLSVMYLSTMYKRNELQLRVGVFFSFASLSGAFGGLLAYGIERMEGDGGLKGLPWIFIMEGIGTVLVAIFAVYYMPKDLATASFLTVEERHFAVERLNYHWKTSTNGLEHKSTAHQLDQNYQLENAECTSDSQEKARSDEYKMNNVTGHQLIDEEFEIYEVIRGFKEPQVWITGIGYMGLLVCLYSFALFLPTIVLGMGYSGLDAQLFSSFPYLPASVLVVVIAFVGDRLQSRGPIILLLTPIAMVGYIICIASDSNHARYGGVFLMAAGIYPAIPAILCILPNNVAGLTKRSTVTALHLMISNCGGFVATFIYTHEQSPRYKKGHSIALGFIILTWMMFFLNSIYCWKENQARANHQRDSNLIKYDHLVKSGQTKAPIGDRDPNFKFTI
ncbi:major facilitator superfamily domain-containing protein [Melampsora americana]|nr:major facilitator superfamily domain-containing protein [Melampsora americana]